MLSKKDAIKKIFSKNPKFLYHISMEKVLGVLRESYNFFEDSSPFLEQKYNKDLDNLAIQYSFLKFIRPGDTQWTTNCARDTRYV
ncbi:hypothetical protein MSG28_004000 [Choristoneura fumiferana]|uniref:Uncharacterized protein n=1 Tax=Choristoneura fumiferana TaxID=7141 RepID=A0ACC0KGZ8_CHOFU|nr:hypothetical protein MSG28_004000 [Choristoneura fumiferana]